MVELPSPAATRWSDGKCAGHRGWGVHEHRKSAELEFTRGQLQVRRDRLPAWPLSAEPRLSPKVCRDARSQQSDPRAFPSPEGTNPTLRNTSRGEQRGKSGPESQGTRLASGTYTESAVEAAEVRGDARALGHVTLAFAASDCANLQRACPCPGERGAACD